MSMGQRRRFRGAIAGVALGCILSSVPFGWMQSAYASDAATLVAQCDRLAAHPEDPARVTDGVSQSSMDQAAARAACQQAVQAAPDNGRVRYQHARVLFYLGENEAAVKEMQQAADLGHVQAQYIFGTFIVRGRPHAPTDLCLAERYWREAAAGGRQAARVQYLRLTLQNRFIPCSDALDDAAIESTYRIASEEAKDFYERLVL